MNEIEYVPTPHEVARRTGYTHAGKYQITNEQYAAFVQDTDWRPPRHWAGSSSPPPRGAQDPVVNVNHFDAHAFTFWLTQQLGGSSAVLISDSLLLFLCNYGYGVVVPWGAPDDPTKCNSADSRVGWTTPVDHYEEHYPRGSMVDVVGNCWEMTSTYLDDRGEPKGTLVSLLDAGIPEFAFRGSWSATMRKLDDWEQSTALGREFRFVIRGGCYASPVADCRISMQAWTSAFNLGAFAGFRVALRDTDRL